ncbi:MAG TPA: DUF6599 family protein [Bryobacteraceae bacterium]|nr:DUF6599 family protein [Bryobacteraceae bacterium]
MRVPAVLFFLTALIPVQATPAILPDTIGAWQKGTPSAAPAANPKVWQEYGLQDSETAPYSANGTKYEISAWRFADATGSWSAFTELVPKDARPLQVTDRGAETAADEYVIVGNYLFAFKGYKPKPEELNHVVGTAPHYAQSPLPTLPKYLPADAEPNTVRYITGPASLAEFAPSIPPSTAAFHFESEAALAQYRVKGGMATVLVFSFPTMEMARHQLPAFQAVPGAIVKRTGPLVALTLNSPNPDDSERLLSQVKFQAEITVPEHVPTLKDNPANLFLNIIILCGVLAALCVVSGLVVGGLRMTLRRAGASGEGDSVISLHLSGRH